MYNIMMNNWHLLRMQGVISPFLEEITVYETCLRLGKPENFKYSWWITMRNDWLNQWREYKNG